MGTGGHGDLWPELKGTDRTTSECTYARLKALEKKGHRIVLIWPTPVVISSSASRQPMVMLDIPP